MPVFPASTPCSTGAVLNFLADHGLDMRNRAMQRPVGMELAMAAPLPRVTASKNFS